MIRSVIFDCDGVLVDTEPIANRVLAGLLTEAGLPTTTEDSMRDYKGRAMRSVLALAGERLGSPLPPDIADRYYGGGRGLFRTRAAARAGRRRSAERITLPSCVASSGPHTRCRDARTDGPWSASMDGSSAPARSRRESPRRTWFLHAARRMGCDPATTACVEDSGPGVEAARRRACGRWRSRAVPTRPAGRSRWRDFQRHEPNCRPLAR